MDNLREQMHAFLPTSRINSRVTYCVFVGIRTISNNSCTQNEKYILYAICLFRMADGFRCN